MSIRILLSPCSVLKSHYSSLINLMATKAHIAKAKRSLTRAKFPTRVIRRCWRCGRKGAHMRDFNMCRICFRELASRGEIPGVVKASW